jgi:hypothetical protein
VHNLAARVAGGVLVWAAITMAGACGVHPNGSCVDGTECPADLSPTQSCEAGTWDHDGNSATACVPLTDCIAGQRIDSDGTATSDRTCTACASGTFSTTANAVSCTPFRTCVAGTYVSGAGTATEDRRCSPCPDGTHSTSENQSQCQPETACPAGTEQTAPATATSPPTCVSCAAGTYCAGGTSPKVTCGGATWDHDADSATACAAKTECVAGQSVTGAGSATSDRTCASCTTGTFSTTANASSCATWSTCAAGSYVSAAGTATSDRQCTTCPNGQTSYTQNAASCVAVLPGAACGGELTDSGLLSLYTNKPVTGTPSYFIGGSSQARKLGSYTSEMFVRSCNSSTGCGAWSSTSQPNYESFYSINSTIRQGSVYLWNTAGTNYLAIVSNTVGSDCLGWTEGKGAIARSGNLGNVTLGAEVEDNCSAGADPVFYFEQKDLYDPAGVVADHCMKLTYSKQRNRVDISPTVYTYDEYMVVYDATY